MSLTVAIAATLNVNAATEIDYSPAEYLKNYALSVCIAEGYSAKEVKNDAAAAARGYMEFGDYSLEAHTAVRALAKEFLAKPYDSMSGEPMTMTMAKYIDLVHSQALQAIIKKYQGKDDS
ncbi:T6SS amidase immunity protein Tai4 family protein [Serratia marcescens]|uniref:T6SS amidase immunity protein Tai4 family protein n=1 Tax=Serratia marcescens TaxID=615 RepID=UPI002AB36595|nr:T6SS amidase immunity protein Tai4 family protein [Serratia marcescens]MDY7606318.1 T6SS amidase immunity protein Tai4 family protein [Serratia marcescens]